MLDIGSSESTLSRRESVGRTLAEVVVEVGVPPTTIRSWERRYRWPEPTRSRGGHRRYSPDHVRQIVALRDAISRGYSPRVAVPVLRSLEKKRQEYYLQQIGSISGNEPGPVMAVLDDARRSLGVRTAVEGVVFPLIRELGDARDAGGERATTYKGLREWLREQLEDDSDGPLAVLACAPSGDVPLEAAALAVLVARWAGPAASPKRDSRTWNLLWIRSDQRFSSCGVLELRIDGRRFGRFDDFVDRRRRSSIAGTDSPPHRAGAGWPACTWERHAWRLPSGST